MLIVSSIYIIYTIIVQMNINFQSTKSEEFMITQFLAFHKFYLNILIVANKSFLFDKNYK